MKTKITRSTIAGAVCILFAVWILSQLGSIRTNLVSNEPGPRFFPMISAIGIIICSVLSMIFDGKKERDRMKKSGKLEPYLTKAGWKRLLIIMLEVIMFGIGMVWIGFLFTSVIMTFVIMLTLKGDKKINMPFAIAFSVGLSVIVYFGFTKGFIIPLPTGNLWDILGINLQF